MTVPVHRYILDESKAVDQEPIHIYVWGQMVGAFKALVLNDSLRVKRATMTNKGDPVVDLNQFSRHRAPSRPSTHLQIHTQQCLRC
jgi:hypothetical protein